jgi:hypothetical protein
VEYRVPSLVEPASFAPSGEILTHERFETAGAVVGEPLPATAAEFGANGRSKAFFESAISSAWQKTTQGIFDTGCWLQQAREELDRDVYNALRLPFGLRTKQRLIAIVTHPVLATHVSQLPPSWGTLYALTQIDDHDLLRTALADGRINPDLERGNVRNALGLPPKPWRRAQKKNGQDEKPLDPAAVWAAFSSTDKTAILKSEGRSGLAALLGQELLVDLVDHAIRQQLVGASTKPKPAVTLTAVLRAMLDPASVLESNAVLDCFKAKLKSLGLDLHDVSVAVRGQKTEQKKRGRR